MLKPDRILVSDARYPMIVVEFHGTPDDDEFNAYLARMDEIQKSPASSFRRIAIIQDTLHQRGSISASQRRKMITWQNQNQERIARTVAGIAFVIDSAIVRGAATAMLWLYKPVYDYAAFATRSEAEEWALRKLTSASQPPRSASG